MKGSTIFWTAIVISAILFGEYQLYIHRDTWRTGFGNPGLSLFYVINIIVLILWEVIFGMNRDIYYDRYNDHYNFKKDGFIWIAFSPIFLIYILIRYYINPFLDKLLY